MPPKKIFFICSVNSEVGFGNFSRSLRLAREFLRRKYQVTFVLCNSLKVKVSDDIKAIYINSKKLEGELLKISAIPGLMNAICVLDRKGAEYNYLAKIKEITPFLLDINGEYYGKNPADLIIRGDFGEKTSGRILGGVRYKLLGGNFNPVRKKSYPKKTVILSFGGSDPSGISQIAAVGLEDNKEYDFKLIVGNGYRQKHRIKNPKIDVVFGEKNLGNFFPYAHAAIVSSGITLYEAFACGIPCLVAPQNNLQLKEARALERLGLVRVTSKISLVKDVLHFINHDNLLAKLRKNIRGKVDLKAAARVADAAEKLFNV